MLELDGLTRRFGDVVALQDLTFSVAPGRMFGFVGPNGAGKTTTVEILEGYRRRDGGEISILGTDPAAPTLAWRTRIGVVLQASTMPAELTVHEIMERYAGFYPHPLRVEDTLAMVGLADKGRIRIGKLSGGQLRRLDVALAIVGDPQLVFLDEPTTGFDPAARRQAWTLVQGLRELGKTVFLTTHYMDEAEALADRVAVIVAGRIVVEGSPQNLGGRDTAPVEIYFRQPQDTRLPAFAGATVARDRNQVAIRTTDPVGTLGVLLDWARAERVDLPGLEVRPPSLEEIYLRLSGDVS
jgi:ABC-2 type transport system ATP-binding protein